MLRLGLLREPRTGGTGAGGRRFPAVTAAGASVARGGMKQVLPGESHFFLAMSLGTPLQMKELMVG